MMDSFMINSFRNCQENDMTFFDALQANAAYEYKTNELNREWRKSEEDYIVRKTRGECARLVKSAKEKFLREFEFYDRDDFEKFILFVDELEKTISGDR